MNLIEIERDHKLILALLIIILQVIGVILELGILVGYALNGGFVDSPQKIFQQRIYALFELVQKCVDGHTLHDFRIRNQPPTKYSHEPRKLRRDDYHSREPAAIDGLL